MARRDGASPHPRERLTPGGGAGDDEAGGFAEPVRHGAGRGRARRRRRSSPHAAAPRMRSAGRAGDARAASGGGWAKRAAVPEGETLRGAAGWDGDGGCEGLGGPRCLLTPRGHHGGSCGSPGGTSHLPPPRYRAAAAVLYFPFIVSALVPLSSAPQAQYWHTTVFLLKVLYWVFISPPPRQIHTDTR